MRATLWKRWATCALALSICVPAIAAARGDRSLDDCTAFAQEDKDESTVAFTVHNNCTIPIDCTLAWRVVCAPDSKKRRSTTSASRKLALGDHSARTAEASAAVCGDDSWTIDQVEWRCEPNRE